MQVRLLVERGQDECIVKLAGTSYKFKRNEHGHLVAEITDLLSIQWVSDPRNSSFIPYTLPKPKAELEAEVPPATDPALESNVGDEIFDEIVPAFAEPIPDSGTLFLSTNRSGARPSLRIPGRLSPNQHRRMGKLRKYHRRRRLRRKLKRFLSRRKREEICNGSRCRRDRG